MMCRNKLLTFLTTHVILSLPVSLFGQAIKTDPTFPAEDKPLTIVFDVSVNQDNELEGYNGQIYVHTGVILAESDKNSGNWLRVIAEWAINIPPGMFEFIPLRKCRHLKKVYL